MTLCFIPAHAGSKCIPDINTRMLGGRPLIAWTIESALTSDCFDRIVVSTSDEAIRAIAERSKIVTDRTAADLAGDGVKLVQIVDEYLRRPENSGRYTQVAVLLPTCPFRNASDVRESVALQREAPQSFVVTISAYDFPPEFAFDADAASGELHLRHPEVYARSTQSQSVAPAYHPNGAIYVCGVDRFLETKSFFAPPIRAILLPPERAFDVDQPHQWTIAESIAEKLCNP